MNSKTEFVFDTCSSSVEGTIARLMVDDGIRLPLVVFIDNWENVQVRHGQHCCIAVKGVGSNVKIFADENEYLATTPKTDVVSLIPTGEFMWHNNAETAEPYISFTGYVTEVDSDPDAGEDAPNYLLAVETLDMTFDVYLHYDGEISKGNVIHADAWIYGDLEPVGEG